MHVLVNGVRLFFDVEGASLVARRPRHAGKADLADAAWRPRRRPFDLQTRLLRLGGRRPDRLPRPSRQWPQRGRPQGGMDAGAMGRRCARVLRRLRDCQSDRAGRVVRRHGRAGLRHAPSGASFKTDPDQHRGRGRLASGAARGAVRTLRRPGSGRAGAPPVLRARGHDEASLEAWRRLALPHYFRNPRHPDVARRAVSRPEVLQWFTRPGGESQTFDLFPDLHRIQCPTLIMGGEDDPIHPIESQAELAAALPAHLVQFERFPGCRHAVVPDAPERAMAVIRDFIERS